MEYYNYRQSVTEKGALHKRLTTWNLQNKLKERLTAAQFRQSILQYMSSDHFNPQEAATPELVKSLFE